MPAASLSGAAAARPGDAERRLFAGGLRRTHQTFDRTAACNTAAMLFLAVVALIMPAVFDLAVYGNLEAHPAAIDRGVAAHCGDFSFGKTCSGVYVCAWGGPGLDA